MSKSSTRSHGIRQYLGPTSTERVHLHAYLPQGVPTGGRGVLLQEWTLGPNWRHSHMSSAKQRQEKPDNSSFPLLSTEHFVVCQALAPDSNQRVIQHLGDPVSTAEINCLLNGKTLFEFQLKCEETQTWELDVRDLPQCPDPKEQGMPSAVPYCLVKILLKFMTYFETHDCE